MTRADRIRLFKRERCSDAEICEYLDLSKDWVRRVLQNRASPRERAPTFFREGVERYVSNGGRVR